MILHTYTYNPIMWICILAVGIVLVVVNLLISRYMHKDALKRGIKNSEFWLLMGFILGLLGLLLYIFVRKNYEERT